METFIFVEICFVIILAIVLYVYFERKRRLAIVAVAAKLGFEYHRNDDLNLATKFGNFVCLNYGHDRWAKNTISGKIGATPVHSFDYHYETGSGKNRTQHYVGCVVYEMDFKLKDLLIRKEGFSDKIAAAVGFDDIDFESHEFSKKFYVKAADRKFAYDVIDPRMMEFLLANPEFAIELNGNAIMFYKTRKLKPAEIEPGLKIGERFVSLIPEFVKRELTAG